MSTPPSGSPKPSQTPQLSVPKYGFNRSSELLNGRAAMVGLVALLLIEYLTGQGLLSWLGWR
jgi:Chlorophyll A-B binding protein